MSSTSTRWLGSWRNFLSGSGPSFSDSPAASCNTTAARSRRPRGLHHLLGLAERPLSRSHPPARVLLRGWRKRLGQHPDPVLREPRGHITNPTGQLLGYWSDTSSTPPTSISDAQIAAEAVKSAQHFGGSNPDADYIVATPTGTGTVGFKTQYCAWHSITGNTAFTNLPYMTDAGTSCGKDFVNPAPRGDTDGITIVGGHEYAETVTDPGAGSGWIDASGGENGDKCAWISSGQGKATNIQLGTGAYAVQSLWSNQFTTGGLFGHKGGCVTG